MVRSGRGAADDVDRCSSLLYVILVHGALERAYSDRLSGMAIAVCETPAGPRTILAGVLVDQAALQGVLKSLYELGLPVLAVTCA
jgi:hypothetical protein